jgi:hypothetical protein
MAPKSKGVLKVLGNNYKIMINMVQKSPPSIMITRKSNGLRKSG